MVMAWFLGLMKFKEKDEEDLQQTKAPSEKSESLNAFLKTPETKKFVSEWQEKKKFTKRGIEKLLGVLWLQHDSNKKIMKAAGDILSALTGEDGLLKVLSGFKLVPEGLRKILG